MPRQKTFNEKEVLKSATDLFWQNGFHQTSIQDLVDKLAVNRASLYDTYKDKEGLFNQCFCLYRDLVIQSIDDIFSNEKTIKDGFNSLFDFVIQTITNEEKKGCLISNTYSELLPTKNPDIITLLDEARQLWIEALKSKLNQAKKQKEINKNINISKTSEAMYSSIVGISILAKTNIEKKTLKNSIDFYLDIFN